MVNAEESKYLAGEYSAIDYRAARMQKFLSEIYGEMEGRISGLSGCSALDIGCGRGYFLNFLHEKGLNNLAGIDPCNELLEQRLYPNITSGSYEKNGIGDNAYDIVFTCHTLHHLADPRPVYALKEMRRIARRFLVIVEINNTNLPMFLLSVVLRSVERNAFLYNKARVRELIADSGCRLVHEADMKAGYLSGDGLLHRIGANVGARPYNIFIAEK